MGRPEFVSWGWLLFLSLSWSSVEQATAKPQFMVVVPAVIEAGAEATFCSSLLVPNESLNVTVSLVSPQGKTVLYQQTHSSEFHTCSQFKAPLVEDQEVQDFEVEVHGDTFHSKETRKVQIRSYKPRTFIQTDKPIYLPGQTVHFRVITLDSRLRPAVGLYDVIEIEDAHDNRIGQWLNTSSDGKILQLSYTLNPEAREGLYSVSVSIKGSKTTHRFKVEKYVLPKFSVKTQSPDEVSVAQEEFSFDVCGTYTFGQSVPGIVEAKLCRNPEVYRYSYLDSLPTSPLCHTETKSKPSTSRQTPSFANTATQTETVKMCSVGTQLSIKTLQPHVKSIGTQAKLLPVCTDVTVGTTGSIHSQAFLSSTPLKRTLTDIEGEITPIKKPCLEQTVDDSFEGGSTMLTPHDCTYDPEDSISALSEVAEEGMASSTPIHQTPTYIVYETCLLQLFEVCPICQQPSTVRTQKIGTFLCVEQRCTHCEFFRKWNSQPLLGSIPAGNLQLSVAIYSSGGSFFKVAKIFWGMRLRMFQYNTFRRHARTFIEPAIIHKWNTTQNGLTDKLKEQNAIVGGDMRADSPGFT